MKKLFLSLLAVMFIAASILIGCYSHDKKVENAQQNVQDAKENVKDAQQELNRAKADTVSDLQKFKNEANKVINDNEKQIADLRLEMKKEQRVARRKYEKMIDAIEKKNHELKVKLEAYKNDGKKDWKEFKTEFNNELTELGKDYKDLADKITK